MNPATTDEPGRRALALTAVAWGLGHALTETAVIVALTFVPGALSWRAANSPLVIAPEPVVYVPFFLVVALLVALLPRRLRRVPRDQAFAAVAGWISAFVLLSAPGQILTPLARAVLALGIAAVAFRAWRRDPPRARAVLRRGLLPGVLVWLLGTALIVAGTAARERWTLGRIPAAPRGTPNILLLVIDTERADHLSSYGYARATTPRLDALARRGLLFETAVAPSAWTLPSHATFMTGRPQTEHRAGVLRRPFLDRRYPTIAASLAARGYATGGFVANTWWCGRQTGLDRGFLHYEDFFGSAADAAARTVLGRTLAYEVLPRFGMGDVPGRKRADRLTGDVLGWLDRTRGHPFFVFVNYLDVHEPLLPPAPFRGRFSGTTLPRQGGGLLHMAQIDDAEAKRPENLRRTRDAYDESLLFLDQAIGALLDSLDARGMADSTLVIVTSDHGESFGEHGFLTHGHSLYWDQLDVPLIVRWPGHVAAGGRWAAPVSLDRLAATVATAAGVGAGTFPGASLLDSASREPVVSDLARRWTEVSPWPASRTNLTSLTAGPWHLIRPDSGALQLFDYRADPGEVTDLAADRRAVADSLAAVLERVRPRARRSTR